MQWRELAIFWLKKESEDKTVKIENNDLFKIARYKYIWILLPLTSSFSVCDDFCPFNINPLHHSDCNYTLKPKRKVCSEKHKMDASWSSFAAQNVTFGSLKQCTWSTNDRCNNLPPVPLDKLYSSYKHEQPSLKSNFNVRIARFCEPVVCP